ncbi:hypothetical protein HGRIS_013544 [Hohenbuehelia grisea]
MLVKQWLSAYTAGLPTTPRLRSQMRQRRYDTLCAWRTQGIINCMPLVLSCCLITFLLGLAILLLELNKTIGILFAVIVAITIVFHAMNIILPALCNCPWKTAISPIAFPLLLPLRLLLRGAINLGLRMPKMLYTCYTSIFLAVVGIWGLVSCIAIVLKVIVCIPVYILSIPVFGLAALYERVKEAVVSRLRRALGRASKYRLVFPPYLQKFISVCSNMLLSFLHSSKSAFMLGGGTADSHPWPHGNSEDARELHAVQTHRRVLEADALLWLMRSSPSKQVVDTAVQSLAGLPAEPITAELLLHGGVSAMLRDRLSYGSYASDAVQATERYLRAILRIRLVTRYLEDARQTEEATTNLLGGFAIKRGLPNYITYICAKGALNDMIDALEAHHTGETPLSPFSLFLLVHTLGQEAAWRKAPKDDHWAMGQTGGWAQVSVRAVPLLLSMLEVEREDLLGAPLVDSAIAFTIATFTQSGAAVNAKVYMDERRCQQDFYYLIVTGLSPILRFPASYGCEGDMLDVAAQKYMAATRQFVSQRNQKSIEDVSGLMVLLRSSLGLSNSDTKSSEALLTLLSQMSNNLLTGIDYAVLVRALRTQNMTPMFSQHLLATLERLVCDCGGATQLVDAGLVKGLQDYLRGPISPVRSQAFRLLGRTACSAAMASAHAMSAMVEEGLLDLAMISSRALGPSPRRISISGSK